MGAIKPPQPSSFLPQRLFLSQLPDHTHPGTSPDRAVAKGTRSSSGPSRNTQRKSLLEASGLGVEGCGWGPEVVGTQLCGLQDRRILIPWTERQRD